MRVDGDGVWVGEWERSQVGEIRLLLPDFCLGFDNNERIQRIQDYGRALAEGIRVLRRNKKEQDGPELNT
jgi:hypothetical protein